jgi:seryl-tRNA synthetase
MTALDMADFDRGTKVHGFRGYFLKNDGALLCWAIWNYARDFFLKKKFNPFIAPAIVNKEYFIGTGHLPGDAEDIFQTQDDQYLAGTAEVPMMAYHADEILSKEQLPVRYLAFSPCYRREAGSHGKDIKGLIRVHEFFKWEQLVLCEASHDESVKLHEELNRNTEEFIESLGIPYRQLMICTGDMKAAHVKSYDTELWVPKENKYREIASASYYHDFQTRRFNIRYKDADGKTKYTHSLNATAIPTPRILVSLVENYQQADGSIVIPEALRPYMGGKDKITK